MNQFCASKRSTCVCLWLYWQFMTLTFVSSAKGETSQLGLPNYAFIHNHAYNNKNRTKVVPSRLSSNEFSEHANATAGTRTYADGRSNELFRSGDSNSATSNPNQAVPSRSFVFPFLAFPKWHRRRLDSRGGLDNANGANRIHGKNRTRLVEGGGALAMSSVSSMSAVHSQAAQMDASKNEPSANLHVQHAFTRFVGGLWMKLAGGMQKHRQDFKTSSHMNYWQEAEEGQQRHHENCRRSRETSHVSKSKSATLEIDSCTEEETIEDDLESHAVVRQQSTQVDPVHIVQRENINCDNDDDCGGNDDMQNNQKGNSQMLLHTYHYPPMNITLYGLSLTLPKFKAWIGYMLQTHSTFNQTNSATALFDMHTHRKTLFYNHTANAAYDVSVNHTAMNQYITTENITIDPDSRQKLRNKWFDRLLISDRTEVFASYPSNQSDESNLNENTILEQEQKQAAKLITGENGKVKPSPEQSESSSVESSHMRRKRGGFNDLLSVYAERLITMLRDERFDRDTNKSRSSLLTNYAFIDPSSLIGEVSYLVKKRDEHSKNKTALRMKETFNLTSWLHEEYGYHKTNKLMYDNFSKMEQDDQFKALQHFLDWFRGKFPYYYDRCDTCNASFRDDENNGEIDDSANEDDAQEEKIDGTFLGYMYPTHEEIELGASRVELYNCHKCQSYTRFPRFNKVSSIVKYGRGRCGEYSILMWRMFRQLGHNARWVIDWSDHVWVECWMRNSNCEGRWIHLDPCEAACDQPYLYQDWGKKQTLIMAFWAPKQDQIFKKIGDPLEYESFPLIEDVTSKYTTESMDIIQDRRDEPLKSIQASIQTVETSLKERIKNFTVI